MLDRARSFVWAVQETIADDVVRIDGATVLRTPSLPGAWGANCLRLEGPHPGLTLGAAEALCAEHVSAVPYRQLVVDDEGDAERLAGEADGGDWEVERELVMALGDDRGREVDTSVVREGSLHEVLELMEAWYREEEPGLDADGLADLVELARREHAATPERRFVVEDPPGRPAAMTSLRERDRVCQLEDVYALPDVRGRGHGRALVAHATAFARDDDHDLVFILADDDGWPQHLYASFGFTPLGRGASLRTPRVP